MAKSKKIKLQSLQEFNQIRIIDYTVPHPRKNGIACPNCDKELSDSDAHIIASYPPKRNIHCECGFRGLRIW